MVGPKVVKGIRRMLSYYAMNNSEKPRDPIWNYLKTHSLNKDAPNEPFLYTLAMMDGGVRRIRAENYDRLLQIIFEQAQINGGNVPWYLVECLHNEETPVRLYIDLDILTLKELIPDDIKRITAVIEREIESFWDCSEKVKAKTCVTAPTMAIDIPGYISPSGRVLKVREKEKKTDINDFFNGETFRMGSIKKIGVHWYFPQIVLLPSDSVVFASFLIKRLKVLEPGISWNDALDLSVYKGNNRGAFRLPFNKKCTSCRQKSAFIFDHEKGCYKIKENISVNDAIYSRPPTMVCGMRRLASRNTSLPCEFSPTTLFPAKIGPSRAREVRRKSGKTKVSIENIDMDVICPQCESFGHYNVNELSYQPFGDDDIIINPRDYSIFCLPGEKVTLKKPQFDKISKCVLSDNNNDNKVNKLWKSQKRRVQKGAKVDHIQITDTLLNKLVSALKSFKVFGHQPWKDLQDFEINIDEISTCFKLSGKYKRILGKKDFVNIILSKNKSGGPVVRLLIYDRVFRFCILKCKNNPSGHCFSHESNGSYIEISCLGIRTYCLDDVCEPEKKNFLQWRSSGEAKVFWKAFSSTCPIYQKNEYSTLLAAEAEIMDVGGNTRDIISSMILNLKKEENDIGDICKEEDTKQTQKESHLMSMLQAAGGDDFVCAAKKRKKTKKIKNSELNCLLFYFICFFLID